MLIFLIAAALSFLIALIHAFAGSKSDVRPLLVSDMEEPAKSTMYYCWHLVTITLFGMGGLYVWTAYDPVDTSPAIIATCLAIAFSIWGFCAAGIRSRSILTELPQGILFLVPAGVGLWGLWLG